MEYISVYLDTNIFSRLTDLKISEETARAYRTLGGLHSLKLVTSEKTRQEVQKAPNEARASVLIFLLSAFSKVPWTVSEYSGVINGSPIGMCAINEEWTHPVQLKLREIFDEDDAEHIFQASQSKCRYFLTLDEKTILSRARARKAELSILCPQLQFCSPVELIGELDGRK